MTLNEKTMQKTTVVVGLAVLANMLWGSAAPVIKTGYRLFQVAADAPSSQILFAGVRFFLAGILAVLLGSLIYGEFLKPKKSSIKPICILALFQTIIQYTLFYIGCAHATGTKVTIASSTGAFISILFSALLFRQEKLTVRKILGCILGFTGVVLVNLSPGSLDLDMSFIGEGFVLLSTCAFALANTFSKHFSKTENPVMMCGYQFILGGAVMTVMGLALGGKLVFPGVSGLLLIVYLAMVSAVAFGVTTTLMKYNPVSRVSIFGFLNPMFGVTLSILILKESRQEFGIKGIIALLLVCLGVFIVNYNKAQKQN